MKTCCPGCQTVFRVTSEQLRARAGKVRCGQCRKVFSALESLLDDSEPIVSAPPPTASPERAETAVLSTTPEAPAVAVLLRKQEIGNGAEIAPADGSPGDATTARVTAASPSEVLTTLGPDSLPDSPPGTVAEPLPLEAATVSEATPDPATVVTEGGDADGAVVPSATGEVAGHRRWLDGATRKRWSATAGRRPSRPFLIAIVLLVLLLVGQLVFHFRGTIVLIAPTLRPALSALSEAFGTDIPLPRHADLVSIEASELQSEPGRNKLLALQATLRNRASYAQAYPAIELTLTDTDDQAVARRVFMPEEYLPASALAEKSFRANGDVEVRLSLDAKTVNAAGYRLYVFYP